MGARHAPVGGGGLHRLDGLLIVAERVDIDARDRRDDLKVRSRCGLESYVPPDSSCACSLSMLTAIWLPSRSTICCCWSMADRIRRNAFTVIVKHGRSAASDRTASRSAALRGRSDWRPSRRDCSARSSQNWRSPNCCRWSRGLRPSCRIPGSRPRCGYRKRRPAIWHFPNRCCGRSSNSGTPCLIRMRSMAPATAIAAAAARGPANVDGRGVIRPGLLGEANDRVRLLGVQAALVGRHIEFHRTLGDLDRIAVGARNRHVVVLGFRKRACRKPPSAKSAASVAASAGARRARIIV